VSRSWRWVLRALAVLALVGAGVLLAIHPSIPRGIAVYGPGSRASYGATGGRELTIGIVSIGIIAFGLSFVPRRAVRPRADRAG
jgi:hypothetical protein